LTEQKEYCADQSAGMADTNPEHEVDDRKAPGNWVNVSPDANAFPSHIAQARTKDAEQAQSECKRKVPGQRRLGSLHDARYVVRDLSECVIALQRTIVRISGGRCGHRSSKAPDAGWRCEPCNSHGVGC